MIKFAVRNLLSRPVRSLLSLLGLTVAIVGMVGLFSVAEGLDEQVSSTFDRVPGLVAMQPGAPIPLFSRLPADWQQDIAAIEGVAVVSGEVWQRVNVIDGKMIISPPRFLFGVDIESRLRLQRSVYREDMIDGRYLALDDRGTRNAVVSKHIAEEFDKWVGDTLRVNGYDVRIVGIYHCGSLLLDVAIIVDVDQVRAMTRFDPNSVSAFYIEQTGEVDDDELVERIQTALRGRKAKQWRPSSLGFGGISSGNALANFFGTLGRTMQSIAETQSVGDQTGSPDAPMDEPRDTSSRIGGGTARTAASSPGAPPGNAVPPNGAPVEVRSSIDWADRFEEFSADLDILLTILTGIGVTIAVLSIVNTMLMSVTERIIEFGILKANGWTKTDVLKLVTFESASLGFAGGILGSLVGWSGTLVANWYWETRIHLFASPGLLLFSVCFSTALGIFGGLYPAFWAMRMMPMDAIRRG